jgi:hypothetical protein
MMNRHWILIFVTFSMLTTLLSACGEETKMQSTSIPVPSSTAVAVPKDAGPTDTPTAPPATATPTVVSATSTAAQPISGPTLMDVRFALDVDQSGQLIYPAREFVRGVTRVYVRFSYQGFEDVTELESVWYLNRNRVSVGRLPWDGGEAGDYLIWVEDPNGLGRGEWRWELIVTRDARDEGGPTPIGGGMFLISGAAGYVNETWGLSFDPPASWDVVSETADFVTFSSPDGRQGLALRFALGAVALPEVAAAYLKLFLEEHPEAEVVATEEVTMNGEEALLQQVRYTDQESGEQFLFSASALHAGSAYSLWVLGPAEEVAMLRTEMMATLHSIRFSVGE